VTGGMVPSFDRTVRIDGVDAIEAAIDTTKMKWQLEVTIMSPA